MKAKGNHGKTRGLPGWHGAGHGWVHAGTRFFAHGSLHLAQLSLSFASLLSGVPRQYKHAVNQFASL